MNKYINREEQNYKEAKTKFLEKARSTFGPSYNKIPSEKYSTARMGGYLIKDEEAMVIGWVPKLGGVDVYDYIPQTSETIKEYKK